MRESKNKQEQDRLCIITLSNDVTVIGSTSWRFLKLNLISETELPAVVWIEAEKTNTFMNGSLADFETTIGLPSLL